MWLVVQEQRLYDAAYVVLLPFIANQIVAYDPVVANNIYCTRALDFKLACQTYSAHAVSDPREKGLTKTTAIDRIPVTSTNVTFMFGEMEKYVC